MEFGALIKYFRTQKGITQAELAKGICSVPHLSKIENNSKEANEETVALLLERLEISLEEMEEKEGLVQTLLSQLGERINYYSKDNVDEVYQKLQEIEHIIPFSKYIHTYELYKYRYLLFKGFLAEADAQRDLLFKQRKNFSQHEEYLFQYFNAVSLILKGQFKAADDILELLSSDNYHETPTGEFYYHRALVKAALDQSGHAIHFGNRALQIYMSQHNFIRILHTLMLLGINYTHSNIFEEAQSCFQHLIRSAEVLNEERLLPQIYHNMGYLQNKKKNVKEALYYFEKSLALQADTNPHYLVTLFCIGELYYTQNSINQARECFQELSALSKELGSRKFKLLSDFYLLHMTSPEKAFKYLENKVIPHLVEANEHAEDLFRYYKMLANYYNQKGLAVDAVKYLNHIT